MGNLTIAVGRRVVKKGTHTSTSGGNFGQCAAKGVSGFLYRCSPGASGSSQPDRINFSQFQIPAGRTSLDTR